VGRVIGGRAAVVEIGPGGGNEGAAAVRKDEHQLELTTTMRPTQDGEGAAFKGMVCTGDRDVGWKAFEVSSVWPVPSTRSRTRR
jgi:hypothetical protein